MDSDFDRYYHRDLATVIWAEHWPASKIWARIETLPEDSALRRKHTKGHTSLHELLAQVRDAVTTTAHGWRLEGKPKPYPRPGEDRHDPSEAVDLTDPKDTAAVVRFFGRPR